MVFPVLVNNFFDPQNQHCVDYSFPWQLLLVCCHRIFDSCILCCCRIDRWCKTYCKCQSDYRTFYGDHLFCISNYPDYLQYQRHVPAAFKTIVVAAFTPKAVTGGVVGSMLVAMQKGVARGIFSNEAGLGSAPIAAAAAQTNEPVRQGLVSMTGTFIDTIVICTLTGLSIVHYRSMAGRRFRRCTGNYICVPEWSSFPGRSIFLYPDALSGILRLYDDPRLGLLQ